MDVPVRYTVDLGGVKTNQLHIRMQVQPPDDGPLDVALPFMSPGSPVNSRNHTAKLSHLEIRGADGEALPYDKLEDGGWRVRRGAGGPVEIEYTLLADDFASSKNQLNDEHAYLNGAAAFMFVRGHDRDLPATVELRNIPDPSWSSISTLPTVKGSPNTFYAISFQELADSNVEVGRLDRVDGMVDGTHVTVVKHGAAPFKRLPVSEVSPQQNLADFKRIYRAFGLEFGAFPAQRYKVSPALPPDVDSSDRYTIIKHYLTGDVGVAGGFEHYHGHELTFSRLNEEGIHRSHADSARAMENKVMAHELGHKLLGKFVQHDGIDSCNFAREHPSDGLWLTEGITEWLGTIMECRAGLISPDQYLERLQGQVHRYQQDYQIDPTNAREDSLEAQHGNSEYYTKGAVLGAVLDLEILSLSGGQKSFKDVLLGLKDEFGGTGNFHRLADVKRIAKSAVAEYPGAGARLESIFHDYLEDRKPIDFNHFLAHAGLRLAPRTDNWPQETLTFANAILKTNGEGRPLYCVTGTLSSDRTPAATPPKYVTGTLSSTAEAAHPHDQQGAHRHGEEVVEPASANAPAPFRTLVPAAGVSLAWDDSGRLKLSTVSPTGSGFAAGLREFEGAKLDGLSLSVGGQMVDLPVSRTTAAAAPGVEGVAESMSFTFTKTSQFDGSKHQVTVTVPLQPAPRWTIEELPGADAGTRQLRDQWLRQLPEGLLNA